MAQPYIGEIRIFGGNFPPVGWMFCNGNPLPISENEALFQLIGTTYGGDGESTFNLPNLMGRVPMHTGNGPDGVNYPLAQAAGVESVTLTVQQIPVHTHQALASGSGQVQSPAGAVLATATSTQTGIRVYNTTAPDVQLHGSAVSASGGSQPHDNMQPFLGLNFIISLFGLFPQPT